MVKLYSRTQALVTLSSGESEFTAIATGMCEGLFVKNLLMELGYDMTLRMMSDSSAGRSMALRQGVGKVKHLDTKVLFCQRQFRQKLATLTKVKTTENTSDIGTKYLNKSDHEKACDMAGLKFDEELCLEDTDGMSSEAMQNYEKFENTQDENVEQEDDEMVGMVYGDEVR